MRERKMITAFEVGSIFRIIDEASPALRVILKQVNPKVLADVRFCAHTGLIADMAPCPFCANFRSERAFIQSPRRRER
jgi:hypothetical protein